MTVKIGTELLDLMVMAYQARRSVLLIGPTGVGKSELLAQAAQLLGIEYICLDLSLMEAPDLTGLPTIDKGRTIFAVPNFLPIKRAGLLAFEELNRAPHHTQAPCLQLLTARRLNDYILPDGWLPIAAINPDLPDAGYRVEEMDAALLARFSKIEVVADVHNWLEWAEKNAIHPAVRSYVRNTPRIFDSAQSNPRAWKYISDVVYANEGNRPNRAAMTALIDGYVGSAHTRAFMTTYLKRVSDLPSAELIVRAYPRIRKDVTSLVSSGNDAGIEGLVNQVLIFLQDPTQEAAVRADPASVRHLKAFMQDIPAEFRSKLVRHQPWTKKETA